MKPATNPGRSSVPDTSAQPLLTGDLCFPAEIHRGDLILESGRFCVKGKDFSLLGSIELSGTATLIIEGSIFRHLAEYSGGVKLTASGNARVEIQNSIIVSNKVDPAPQNGNNQNEAPHFNTWSFREGASLVLRNVASEGHTIWHSFDYSSSGNVSVKDSDFGGTFNGESSVQASVENLHGEARTTFIELVVPAGTSRRFDLPQTGAAAVSMGKLNVNVAATKIVWGVTINPDSDIELVGRDFTPLTVTMVLGSVNSQFHNKNIRIDDLKAGLNHRVSDCRWNIPELCMSFRLVSIQPNPWSPIVVGPNDVTFVGGEFADNKHSCGAARITYINSTLSHVHIPAHEGGPSPIITLRECWAANVIADAGEVVVENSVIADMAVGNHPGKVSLLNTSIQDNHKRGNVIVLSQGES